jgi:hypothetical protein
MKKGVRTVKGDVHTALISSVYTSQCLTLDEESPHAHSAKKEAPVACDATTLRE